VPEGSGLLTDYTFFIADEFNGKQQVKERFVADGSALRTKGQH
jgi:hypothetical protein